MSLTVSYSLPNRTPGYLPVPQARHSISIDLSCRLPHGELVKLYRSIESALPDTSNRVVQFVSAYPDEGANMIAFETAVIAAQLIGKRVLFIDAAGSRGKTARKSSNGMNVALDTLLLTGQPPHEALAQAAGTSLYVAFLLRERGESGFEAVPLSAIESALQVLHSTFDLIVIDSPAILTDTFSMAMAKLASGSILVIEADRTRMPVAAESKRLVEMGGGRVIGAILNRRRFYIPPFLYRLLYARASV